MEIQRSSASACSARVSGKRDNGKRECAVFFYIEINKAEFVFKKRKETGVETYTRLRVHTGEGKSDTTCENKRN